MSAREMFENLEYKYYEKDSRIKGKIPVYIKRKVINTHYINIKIITFALNGYEAEEYIIDNTGEKIKTIDNVFINTQELQAINKQIEELGRND